MDFEKSYQVYMLECQDKSIYVGVTSRLEIRIAEHEQGKDKKAYTFTRRPLKFLWAESFIRVEDAIAAEKQIKRWSRAKKMALANGEIDSLKRLANPRMP